MTDSNTPLSTILNGRRPESRRTTGATHTGSSNLADLLERVLDKGIIIAGDVTLCLGEIELLQIKIRLLIASVDKARDMGIDWWQHDPALSSLAHKSAEEHDQLTQRLDRLETMLTSLVQDRGRPLSSQENTDATSPSLLGSGLPLAAASVREGPLAESHSAGGG